MTKDELQKAVDDVITDCIRNDYAFGNYAHRVTEAVWPVLEAAEKERDDVAQQLVQSEIGKREISEAYDALRVEVGKLKDLEVSRCVKINGYIVDNARLAEEVERLRAKIEAMERQDCSKQSVPTEVPREFVMDAIAQALGDAYDCTRVWSAWGYGTMSQDDFHLIAEDGARLSEIADAAIMAMGASAPKPCAQPAPSVPDGWLRAIDESLVVANIGVANPDDTYEQAKAKLDNLIGFHVDVATDPAVNGGWKLVPRPPTPTMVKAGLESSHVLNVHRVLACYDAMIDAAPEAKR